MAAGVNPVHMKEGIEKAVEDITAELKKMSIKIKSTQEMAQVGTVASNGDTEIGKMLAEAMEKVGKDGVITVDEGKSLGTEVEWVEGMQFDRGYLSPYFVTDPNSMTCELEDAYVLVHEKKISSVKDLVPVLEAVVNAGKPLLIVAEDIEGEALATLVINKLRGTFQVCAVKAPGLRRSPQGHARRHRHPHRWPGHLRRPRHQARRPQLNELGRAKKIIVDKDNTTIIEGAGKSTDIKGRIDQIRREIENTTSDYDREKLEERLAKLAGGVAKINVGAATESEMKEKKARVEDALHATRAAVEEGILPGGGVALLRASTKVKPAEDAAQDHKVGYNIVIRACRCSADGDRRQRRPRRRHRVRARRRTQRQRRLQRRDRQVRRPGESRRHRPDEGHPHRTAKRRQRRDAAANQRRPDRRSPEERQKGRRRPRPRRHG